MRITTTIVACVLAFGAAAIASRFIFRVASPTAQEAAQPGGVRPPVVSNVGYWAHLDAVDERIAGVKKIVDKRSNDWLMRSHLGAALFERAGLTQQPDDYDKVQAILDEAFTMAVKGSGPTLLAARFNFSIHRLAVAETYLDMIDKRVVPRRDEQIVANVLRGQIAEQRGQYDVAFEMLSTAARAMPAAASAELGLYHAKTGNPTEAVALLESALAATRKNPRRQAWLKLQLGLVAMNRGDLRKARKHLQEADDLFPQWWLVQEHLAEVHQRLDEHAEAIAIFDTLVRTVDLPQHMDALAGLYRHTGQPEKADELIARATVRWDHLLARYPEAAVGHALQHYLRFGPPERALELAIANHANRPGGDAEVALARAYLGAGKPAEALAAVERALATPYRTAGLHDVAAKAHAALGHTAAAEEQVTLLAAIDPAYTGDTHTH